MTEEQKKEYEIAAQAAYDKKGYNISILDMQESSLMADYFVICSARNVHQAQSIADNIEEEMKKQGYSIRHTEGYHAGRWILLDMGDVIAHIFVEEERNFYNLDNLWCDAGRIPFEGQ